MGEKLTGLKPTPVISVTSKVDGFFKGKMLDNGVDVELTTKKGKKYSKKVFSFSALEVSGLDVLIKDKDKGTYISTDIEEGDKVSVFAPTRLARALSEGKVGDVITFKYLGNENEDEAHDFDVERD